MTIARRRERWDHTAEVWAALVNSYRRADARPAHPADVHPLRTRSDYSDPTAEDEDRAFLRRLACLPAQQRAAVLRRRQRRANRDDQY